MAMKKATKERITAAYDKGFEDGDETGYQRAKAESALRQGAVLRQQDFRASFADTLDKEADPE